MGKIVLLAVAAAWAAVLIPPLIRSRIENRPNSSVTDFRRQLSTLQRTVPTRGHGADAHHRAAAHPGAVLPDVASRAASPAAGRSHLHVATIERPAPSRSHARARAARRRVRCAAAGGQTCCSS